MRHSRSILQVRQIQEARERSGIADWGAGYFGIDDQGDVVCYPTALENRQVSIPQAIERAKEKGLRAPLILRFPQVIECQLDRMHKAFQEAIWEYSYDGRHLGVFPFKVNQRREFIDSIVSAGQKANYGLEVGSKTEMIAAMSYPLSEQALLILNGFKDEEFIELGFIAANMGKNVIIVAEGMDELELIQSMRKRYSLSPKVGMRLRLYSRGSGKWEKSSGETSKFGLTTIEAFNTLNYLKNSGLADTLDMLHFHIGSQITAIKRFKNALKEASRVYAKVCKLGFSPTYLNIGGGVGVDYDGSKTTFQNSANYSLQEFANDAVYVVGSICKEEGVPCPDIVSESGRVIAAYHSVVVTDIREVQGSELLASLDESVAEEVPSLPKEEEGLHKSVSEMRYVLEHMTRKNYVEYYHDALEYHEELFTLFNLGYLDLQSRALGEDYFHRICHKAIYYSSFERHQPEEFQALQKLMVNRYLANFSIFQSIPDAWSIDQLFPVMPLSRHDEKAAQKATIVDITCDSDGCVERFVDRSDVKDVLDLHAPDERPYYIGFFLVGAYQESLANEHNLFGAIHEAEVVIQDNGEWDIVKATQGDPVAELLECRNYSRGEIEQSYQRQLAQAKERFGLSEEQVSVMTAQLEQLIMAYPYLKERS